MRVESIYTYYYVPSNYYTAWLNYLEASWVELSGKPKTLVSWKKSYDQPRQIIKKQRNYLAKKDPFSQSRGFSSSHVQMWELDHKEDWAPKNWCFWTVVLDKTLESPLDYKEIKQVSPRANQSWIFIGRTDAEVEAPMLWPPGAKNWLIGKDPDARKDWMWEEKGTVTDEMVGWNTNSIDMSLASYQSWWWTGRSGMLHSMGSKEFDTTEWLNWAEVEEQEETSAGNGKNWPILNKGSILGWLIWTQEERHDIDYIIDASVCAVLYHPVLSDSLQPHRL